ncbi:MAG: peptidase M64 [Bacteroidota bacterium]|nr:peptidase M64 [Bacteroidota bacterium]
MKKRALLFCFFLFTTSAFGFGNEEKFSTYFRDATLRYDFYHVGTKGEERIVPDKMYEEGTWAGSLVNLVDTLNLGEYLFKVIDMKTNRVVYSRGYSCMFNEWQTTDEAASGVYRSFQESVRFPYPLHSVQLTISRRDKRMICREIFSAEINPASPEIHHETLSPSKVISIIKNGDSHKKVDIVILGDGYTNDEMKKFDDDAKHFASDLFSTSPFKEREKDFNIWGVEVASHESGIDQPDRRLWVDNALGTSYNTFGSARYVLTDENRVVRNYAAAAPYDFMIILVNTNRYGGGGIYQLYAISYTIGETPATAWQADYVCVHEFGHCFAGLGDEYYSSSVAYNNFYPKGVEPWEPNLSADPSREHLKWRGMVSSTTPLPTPWNKTGFDSIENERATLNPSLSNYLDSRQELLEAERKVLEAQKYKTVVGAFEGAGYSSTGLYRPSVDCRMFSLSLTGFDPVCSRAIENMIDFYAK